MRNAAPQALSTLEIKKLILDLLERRRLTNAKGGKIIPLSANAQHALETRSIGTVFWNRFWAAHPKLKVGHFTHASRKRTGACEREVAEQHLKALLGELVELGIASPEGVLLFPGRVYNSDETPQFLNYGCSQRTALRVGERGIEIVKYTDEVRTCVTLAPFGRAESKPHGLGLAVSRNLADGLGRRQCLPRGAGAGGGGGGRCATSSPAAPPAVRARCPARMGPLIRPRASSRA